MLTSADFTKFLVSDENIFCGSDFFFFEMKKQFGYCGVSLNYCVSSMEFFLRFWWCHCFRYSDKDVNAEILKSYAGTSDFLPALVLVNHEKVCEIVV